MPDGGSEQSMSTTETSHEPDPAELGHVANESVHDDPVGAGHGAGEPAGAPDGSGHADAGDDEHGHGSEALGPVDVQAWGALVLGVAAGLLVVLCLVITNVLVAAPAA
jgi:hypothetical protein